MLLLHRTAYFLLVLLAFCPVNSNAAPNFMQCFTAVVSCANDTGSLDCLQGFNITNDAALMMLRTSNGSQVQDSREATALLYPSCVKYCGSGQEKFDWAVFSQEYSAWLLPYLALLSQLPFGARRRMDNLMSVILTLGSPTLAAYSLYLTLLNSRWVNDKLFEGIDFPSVAICQSVARALTSLQQIPLRIHPGKSARFESLVVHPDNDEWWDTLASELDYSHTWSIASATSTTWVVIAYLLTVVDSLTNVADNLNSSGEGTGTVWLWLLPIVVGWLVLSPKCDYGRVLDAYNKANKNVFVADPKDPCANPALVASNFGLTIGPNPARERDVASPDELRTPPIFNYARALSWSRTVHLVSLFYRAAWRKYNRRTGVDGKRIPRNARNDIPRGSRLGTREQIIRYCHPDDHEYTKTNTLWPRGVLFNMIVASLMSLQLQWGTTGAALLTTWFTPTIGLGCRSLAYLVYGLLSTSVWFLLVSSSALGYYAHHLIEDPPPCDLENDESGFEAPEGVLGSAIPLGEIHYPIGGDCPDRHESEYSSDASIKSSRSRSNNARIFVRMANLLRWAGKSLAILNAIFIIANSVFQYAGVYDTCYCNSSVYTWASLAFNVITPVESDIELARTAWIGAVALSLTSSMLFVSPIYLLRDSLPS